jgi:hypothetical protein
MCAFSLALAYDPDIEDGVRVAQGQIDRDGIHDWITGSGAGAGPHVKVFSGESGEGIRSFFAYDRQFAGGVNVAAGDIDGDGIDDVITGAGAGAGPHVKVFSGKSGEVMRKVFSGESGEEIRSFFAFDPQFAGGVTVAASDIDGDLRLEIVTGAGPGAGPHVKAFSAVTGAEMLSLYAYDSAFSGGVFVA